jgi:hypothetical protein
LFVFILVNITEPVSDAEGKLIVSDMSRDKIDLDHGCAPSNQLIIDLTSALVAVGILLVGLLILLIR